MSAGQTDISYTSVAIGLGLIAIDACISWALGVGIASDLVVSAGRCVVQLSLMGAILSKVFASKSPWLVAALTFVMIVLGANEVAFGGKTKRRPKGLFLSSLVTLVCAVYPVAIFGTNFMVKQTPWWSPKSLVPLVGLIAGNSVSGCQVATAVLVKEVVENKDKLETYLAHGATRREAMFPIAIESIKLGITPTLTQMSVIGLVSLPGTMSGAILGGESTLRASQLQMSIMFLITATCLFSISLSLFFSVQVLVDSQARIRLDHVDENGSLFGFIALALKRAALSVGGTFGRCCGRSGRSGYEPVPTADAVAAQ